MDEDTSCQTIAKIGHFFWSEGTSPTLMWAGIFGHQPTFVCSVLFYNSLENPSRFRRRYHRTSFDQPSTTWLQSRCQHMETPSCSINYSCVSFKMIPPKDRSQLRSANPQPAGACTICIGGGELGKLRMPIPTFALSWMDGVGIIQSQRVRLLEWMALSSSIPFFWTITVLLLGAVCASRPWHVCLQRRRMGGKQAF